MSEQLEEPVDAAADTADEGEPKNDVMDQPDGTDWFLAWIIGHAESFGLDQGITLTVGGRLITGRVVSPKAYFDLARAAVQDGSFGGEGGEQMKSILADSYGQWAELFPDVGAPIGSGKFAYIHLKEAKVWNGNGTYLPTNGGGLWRGKLSAVDGFFLGELQPGEN